MDAMPLTPLHRTRTERDVQEARAHLQVQMRRFEDADRREVNRRMAEYDARQEMRYGSRRRFS